MFEAKGNEKVPPLEVARQIKAMGYLFPWQRVVILRDPVEEKTKSGMLIIPDMAQEQPRSGTIVGLGEHLPPEIYDYLRCGLRVVFTRYEAMQCAMRLVTCTMVLDFLQWKDVYVLAPCDQASDDDWAAFNAQNPATRYEPQVA